MKKISFLLGCILLCAGIAQAAEKPLIRIGARVFTEQTLLAEITSQYLNSKGYNALESNTFKAYLEYYGATYLRQR